MSSQDRKRVLITGASGLIGGVLREGLADDYDLRGVDRRPIPGFEMVVADTADLAAMQPAFEGVDAVVDLASHPAVDTPWNKVHENNIASTYNALEAARLSGVSRVVFASSNHATGMYENDQPYADIVAGRYEKVDRENMPYITTDMPVRPDGPYGIGKVFGEAAGRYFSDRFGLSVICLRIGTLIQSSRPEGVRAFATLLTHRDLVQLVSKCIDAPDDLKFAIFYGVSNNRWRFWDIGNSRELIGYEPLDNAEVWR